MSSQLLPMLRRGLEMKLVRVAIFYLAILITWELIVRAEVWSPLLFPSPERVWAAFQRNLENGMLLQAVQGSMVRLAIGYAISFAIGSIVGMLIGTQKWADDTFGTVVLGLQSLPSITWLPMAVLWFGLSERAIIFVVLMGSTFSIAISIRDGISNIPPILLRAAGTFGASRWQRYRYVLIPGTLPSLAGGLKQGWTFAWRSLMAGELLFVTMGLGHLLNIGRELNNIGMVFSVMLVIIVIGVAVDRIIFGRLEGWVQERWGLVRA